jgi:hypothetical protein
MMLITCGLTSALNSLEIPYCVGLIGDSSFKIIIKSLEEPHSEEILQRIMECIFISRYKTDLATCLKYAIDKFPHNLKNRVFYTITNGMDPELRKINRWKEAIFNCKENSFSFIFIESRVLKPKQKEFLTEKIWNPFREKIKESISLLLQPKYLSKILEIMKNSILLITFQNVYLMHLLDKIMKKLKFLNLLLLLLILNNIKNLI